MKDITRQKFERMFVESFAYMKRYKSANNSQTKSFWNCICTCGNRRVVAGEALWQGRIKSCGCLSREKSAQRLRTHGYTKTPTYNSWVSMKTRTKNHTRYSKDYYKNVTICERWDKFENFLADMGERPERRTLDRIDPYGNYEPSNCRWLSHKEQMLNQRRNTDRFEEFVTYNPIITYELYRQRVGLGWDKVKAATTPKMKNQYG